mgnify:CR=1 FL=1|tara:strand:- start:1234 stop:1608 length:375 start_codon:yes stop_codon:yes gene_type:complete
MNDKVYTFKKRNIFDPVQMLNETVELGEEWAENKTAYELLKDYEATLKSEIFESLKNKGNNTTSADKLIAKDKKYLNHLSEKNFALKKFLKSQVRYEAKKKLDDLEQTDEVNKRHEMKMSRYQT